MKTGPRIVFFGNHTVGVRTLRVLVHSGHVAGVVAHPDDPEDGVRYESVWSEARRLGLRVIRAPGRSAEVAEFVAEGSPDLIWITDYRYLLPAPVLGLARQGAVNLHPSLLPKYRGRAPINWAILHGETRLGLTAHFVDEGMDTGDIIAQRAYALDQSEDVGTALDRLYPLYEEITAEVLAAFRGGCVPRRPQDHAAATAFPRRRPEDGRIDWNRPAREVWNLIRAVAPPYPGAFAEWGGGRLLVHRAGGIRSFGAGEPRAPGALIASSAAGETLVVACADAGLILTAFRHEPAGPEVPARVGESGLRPVAAAVAR